MQSLVFASFPPRLPGRSHGPTDSRSGGVSITPWISSPFLRLTRVNAFTWAFGSESLFSSLFIRVSLIYRVMSISATQHSDPATHIHAFLSYTIFHQALYQEIGHTSLCFTEGPHCLPIANVSVVLQLAYPANLLEIQNLRPHPRPKESESVLMRSPANSPAIDYWVGG